MNELSILNITRTSYETPVRGNNSCGGGGGCQTCSGGHCGGCGGGVCAGGSGH